MRGQMQECDKQSMTIFMYGDSFSLSNEVRYTSWIDQLHGKHKLMNRSIAGASTVSYTHLTLPTNREV